MKRIILVMLLLFSAFVPGCSVVGSVPTTTILGTWKNERGTDGFQFFSNGVMIEIKPSGNQFGGGYNLSEDGKTLMLKNDLSELNLPITFPDNDTLQIGESIRYKRTAAADPVIDTPGINDLVGSWVFNQYAAAAEDQFAGYDFFADGTYAVYLSGQPSGRGRYEFAADGGGLIQSSEGNSDDLKPRKLTLLTKQVLMFGYSNIYLRIADTPLRPLPGPIGQSQPGITASDPANPQATAIPPPTIGPPPTVQDIPPGQVAAITPYSLMVHSAKILDFQAAAFAREPGQYLVIDVSVRNDGNQPTGGITSWKYAILNKTGERLNEEGIPGIGVAKQFEAQYPAAECMDGRYMPVMTLDLMPGMAFRTWVSFKLTPGLDASDLQFEVVINESKPGPGISFGAQKKLGTATFALNGSEANAPLPAKEPAAEQIAGTDIDWSAATIGPPTLLYEGQPCSSIREVTLTVTNKTAKTSGVPLGTNAVYLVDADGRWYPADVSIVNYTIDGSYRLEPKQTKQVTIPFPHTFGVKGTPVAVMIAENGTWRALAIAP